MGLLGWALVFLTVAGTAAIFGFGGAAGASARVARLLFFVFLAAFAALFFASVLAAGAANA